MKRFHIIGLMLVLVAAAAGVIISSAAEKEPKQTWPTVKETASRLVILGFDGADPDLYEKWRDEGKLPNLKRLEEKGGYSTLATTVPAQSPVAWSSFSTGNNPGKHNIFDFIIRDPKTYQPGIGMVTVKKKRFGKPEITSSQEGETFWEILSKNGIKSEVIRVPLTFPAKPVLGSLLSGLGFESGGLAAAHAIHNGFTALEGTHRYFHGEKVAIGTLASLFLTGKSSETIEQVYTFCEDVGLPTTLAEIGLGEVSDEQIMAVAKLATAPGETIYNEPIPVTVEMVAAAIKAADAEGRRRKASVDAVVMESM